MTFNVLLSVVVVVGIINGTTTNYCLHISNKNH